MRIPHSELQIRMPKDLLQGQYMTAVHHEVTGERVPADVRQLAFR